MNIELNREEIRDRILADPESCWGCGEVQGCIMPEVKELAAMVDEVRNQLIDNEIICCANFQVPYEQRYVLTSDVTPDLVRRFVVRDGIRLESYSGHRKQDQVFHRAWTKAVADALANRIVFRYRGKFYRTEEAVQKAKADWNSAHPQ
jgi:hypothetical protein